MRVGVAGLGVIGRAVCRALDAGLPGLTLAGATARDRGKAEGFLQGLGTPAPFLTLDELVAASDLVVEASTQAHLAEIAPRALGAGRDLVVLSCGGLLGRRHALLDHGAEAAEEVDARLFRGGVEGLGEFDGRDRLMRQRLQQQRDRRDGDPPVRDGNAVLLLERIGAVIEQLALLDDPRLHLPGEPVQVPVDAVLQVDAQGDGADIEVMIQRHPDGFEDFFHGDPHESDPVHSLENVLVLDGDLEGHLLADAVELFLDLADVHRRLGDIDRHRHHETILQDFLVHVHDVDVGLGHRGGQSRDDAHPVRAGDRDDTNLACSWFRHRSPRCSYLGFHKMDVRLTPVTIIR